MWLLNDVLDSEDAEPFVELPSEEEAPDYREAVAEPMSLMMMQEKAMAGGYAALGELRADVERIHGNCRAYCAERFPSLVPVAERLRDRCATMLGAFEQSWAALQRRVAAAAPPLEGTPEPESPEVPKAAGLFGLEASRRQGELKCALRLWEGVPEYVVPESRLRAEVTIGEPVRHSRNAAAQGWILAARSFDGEAWRLVAPAYDEEEECGVEEVPLRWRQVAVLWAKPYLGKITLENPWELVSAEEEEEEEEEEGMEEEGGEGEEMEEAAEVICIE